MLTHNKGMEFFHMRQPGWRVVAVLPRNSHRASAGPGTSRRTEAARIFPLPKAGSESPVFNLPAGNIKKMYHRPAGSGKDFVVP